MNELVFLHNKNILVLGLGATGLSCVRFLASHGFMFSVNDSRELPPGVDAVRKSDADIHLITGSWDSDAIAKADILIASPGVDINQPAIKEHLKPNAEVIGDVELFCRLSKCKIIAVTGSNGKSTVVSLLAHIAKTGQINATLAGNIGLPVLDTLNENAEFAILELSSFQLETMHSMNALAATVLNVSDDHLDRHLTMENYQKIKHRIYYQTGTAVVNKDEVTSTLSADAQHKVKRQIAFGLSSPSDGEFGVIECESIRYLAFGEQRLIACDKLPVVGRHNESNCLAALALGYAAGWSLDKMAQALPSFEGLEHRCKRVISNDGLVWVNDSKATNVGATLAALDGLASTERQLILIAGGDGKGADFNQLKPALSNHVQQLICFGKDGNEICALKENSHNVSNLAEAVKVARNLANSGDLILLSPACASIDMFENYMQRGEQFIEQVREGM